MSARREIVATLAKPGARRHRTDGDNSSRKGLFAVFAVLLSLIAFVVAAQEVDGELDPTFGSGGKVTTDFSSGTDQAEAVAVQPDGKILVAGTTFTSTTPHEFALARYNPDGTLDLTFGGTGKVTTSFTGSVDEAHAMAIQPDGKIVVAGRAFRGLMQDFALARYDSDGTPDSTFGTGGKVTTNFFNPIPDSFPPDFFSSRDIAYALALQPDGNIVAAGTSVSFVAPGQSLDTVSDFALARYNPDGTLDSAFGAGGTVTTDFAGSSIPRINDDEARAVALQPDGKIVVAGWAFNFTKSTLNDFALARYDQTGALDPTFGTGGKVTTDFFSASDTAFAVAVQPDGKIVVAGTAETPNRAEDFALARYKADGSLDSTFGTGGKVTTDFFSNFDSAHAVALLPDGKIVVAGRALNPMGFTLDFALARYNPDGTLDSTFGGDGKVTTAFFPPGPSSIGFFFADDSAFAMAVQPDGKIVVAGTAETISTSFDFALARYLGGVAADTTPPILIFPGTITVDATSPAGAVVTYSVSATDDSGSNPTVSCALPSGSTFPIGESTVTCSATDASGNIATANFQVVVSGAAAQLDRLIIFNDGLDAPHGITRSLRSELRNAQKALNSRDPGDTADACKRLAAVIKKAGHESGKKLTVAQANQLIAAANQIRGALGCSG